MTLAIFSSDVERVRPCFQNARASCASRARETDPELIGAGAAVDGDVR
jgi:hypothetical protein